MIALLLAAALSAQAPDKAGAPAAQGAQETKVRQSLSPTEQRYDHCVNTATSDPDKGEIEASFWRRDGGKFLARQCLGIAFANEQKWESAADEFQGAAQEAEVAHDKKASSFWAQAGNAWLAAGKAAQARSALDAALAAGTLTGVERGEATFDRARALVVSGDLAAARNDIDAALRDAKDDPLIWLASATIARRMNDLERARGDIAQAYTLASDDANIYVEIGNIAAAGGDSAGAQSAWHDAIRIAPDSAAAKSARDALAQFDQAASPAAAKP